MNVLHLQKELNLTCGVTNHIFLIAKNVNKDVNHHVLTLGGDSVGKFSENNIPVLNINISSFGIIAFVKTYFIVLNYCLKNKIDIIHSHHRFCDLIAALISKKIDIKTVTTVHSKIKGWKNFSYKANYFIAVSNSIKKHLIDKFHIDAGKISIINNFIDKELLFIEKDKYILIEQYKLYNSFIIGFIGRFDIPEKGIDILLKAFQLLSGKIQNISLVFIGSGKDEILIEKYKKEKGLNIRIIPPQKGIFDYINICNMVILPSRIDPFPYIMLEAGLMLKPFIGARVDGIAEFIEEGVNGLLFEPENHYELLEKIELLIKNEELRNELAINLNNKVTLHYSKENFVPVYQSFYKNIQQLKVK